MNLSAGTIVDATIIGAPSPTKNRNSKRDPEMRQAKEGNQWYFGMKVHVGVDSQAKLTHSVEATATAANVHDARVLPSLACMAKRGGPTVIRPGAANKPEDQSGSE
jgi:IS5 family transposase